MSTHHDCEFNCGSTDCFAPENPNSLFNVYLGLYYFEQKKQAIEKIKQQPFFK